MRAGPGSLQLDGFKYNIISAIFFIPYVLFQPPATVLLRKIGPKYFLSAITIFWGATMIVRLHNIHDMAYVLIALGFWFRQELGTAGRFESDLGCFGSWFLPWMCLVSNYMFSSSARGMG